MRPKPKPNHPHPHLVATLRDRRQRELVTPPRVELLIGREVRAGLDLVVVQGLVRSPAVGAGGHQDLVRTQGVERALGEARPHARVAQVGHHGEVTHLEGRCRGDTGEIQG